MPILKSYGRQKDKPDVRDFLFRARAVRGPALPSVADLRSHCGAVTNQGNEGSCTAESGHSYVEWANRAYCKSAPILSPQDLYANELIEDGNFPSDVGSSPRTTCSILLKKGLCLESLYPYVAGHIRRPSPAENENGLLFKSDGYYRVPSSAAALACLGNKKPWPVLVAFDVMPSFETQRVADSGIYNPGRNESAIGGHQVLAVGYDVGAVATLRPKACPPAVLLQNSWDTDWGLAGFFWMALPVLDDSATDMWMMYWAQLALAIGESASVAPAPVGSPPGVGFQEWDATANAIAPAGPMRYASDAPAIASVDGQGTVIARAVGAARITATDTANGSSAGTRITVVAA